MIALAAVAAAPAAPSTLVVCAPGYPGTTVDAQPAMDRFAATLAHAAALAPDALAAVYHEREDQGLERLRKPDVALALVPFAFWVQHGAALGLVPRLQAVPAGSAESETWSLVAKKGRVGTAADLSGWELVSIAGYAPAFVRERALAGWGRLSGDVRMTASGQALSALRRAAGGQDVAVLLDGAQSRALSTLPFAADLEVVAVSPALPVSVLCAVRARASDPSVASVVAALGDLHRSSEGQTALAELRLARFVSADAALTSPRK